MPAELELVLALPDHFEGKDAFLAELCQRIAAVEQACAADRLRTGRQVIGRRRILRQSWRDRPASREPRRGLRPRIAARDPSLRVATMRRNKDWLIAYNVSHQRRRDDTAGAGREPRRFRGGTDERWTEDHG